MWVWRSAILFYPLVTDQPSYRGIDKKKYKPAIGPLDRGVGTPFLSADQARASTPIYIYCHCYSSVLVLLLSLSFSLFHFNIFFCFSSFSSLITIVRLGIIDRSFSIKWDNICHCLNFRLKQLISFALRFNSFRPIQYSLRAIFTAEEFFNFFFQKLGLEFLVYFSLLKKKFIDSSKSLIFY